MSTLISDYDSLVSTHYSQMSHDYEVYTTNDRIDNPNASWVNVYKGSDEDRAVDTANLWDKRFNTVFLSRKMQKAHAYYEIRKDIHNSGVTYEPLVESLVKLNNQINEQYSTILEKYN